MHLIRRERPVSSPNLAKTSAFARISGSTLRGQTCCGQNAAQKRLFQKSLTKKPCEADSVPEESSGPDSQMIVPARNRRKEPSQKKKNPRKPGPPRIIVISSKNRLCPPEDRIKQKNAFMRTRKLCPVGLAPSKLRESGHDDEYRRRSFRLGSADKNCARRNKCE